MLHSTWSNRKTALRLNPRRHAQALAEGDEFDSGSSRAPCSRHEKGLNENLAPLKRYLAKQVGRPWDKVYSEIRERIPGSAVGLHVLDHVYGFVARDVFYENGVLSEKWRFGGTIPVEGLYVHPRTGILRVTKPKARRSWWSNRASEQDLDFIPLDWPEAFEKIDGFWFRVRYMWGDEPKTIVLASKQQCDHKTVRRIQDGVFGEVGNKGHWLRVAWCRFVNSVS
jgi:hypothetical protein